MSDSTFSLGPLWIAGSTAQGKAAILRWVKDVIRQETGEPSAFTFDWMTRPERKVTDSSGHLVEVRLCLLGVRRGHKEYVLRFDQRDVESWADQPQLIAKYHPAVLQIIRGMSNPEADSNGN